MAKLSLRYERSEFESRVGNLLSSLQILPNNKDIFYLAFIHRSVLNETSLGYTESNERLEYLGDAVLELVVTEALFRSFPEKTEGELTDIRSALVRGRNLAAIATLLGVPYCIQLSRGEAMALGYENPYILANTFEALLGALYLDTGLEKAREFIMTHVYTTLSHILEKGLYVDPKSYLQEITQGRWGTTPLYEVVEEVGADHNKTYVVSVSFREIVLAHGQGSSKKKAEQDAAENALSVRAEWEGKMAK